MGKGTLSTVQTTGGDQLEVVLRGLEALHNGDSLARLPENWTGTAGKVAVIFNSLAESGRRPSNGGGNGHADHRASDAHTIALLTALPAVKKGDASVRLPLDWTGLMARSPTPSTTWSS